MPSLAVDQNERLVGAEAAQRRGPDRIRSVGDRWLREVERGHELIENPARLGLAAARDLVRADDVDRYRAGRDRPVRRPGAGNDDLLVGDRGLVLRRGESLRLGLGTLLGGGSTLSAGLRRKG